MNVQSALLAQFRNAARDPEPELDREAFAEPELSHLDPIVSAAVLVTSAFRLRDEAALITTLRLLTNAVAAWEAERADVPAVG
jgi:hypothetical protein